MDPNCTNVTLPAITQDTRVQRRDRSSRKRSIISRRSSRTRIVQKARGKRLWSSVLSVDFKKGELEIGIVGGPRTDGKEGTEPGFRALTEEEIDERLQAIADKD
jgi:hypothetical protein